MNTNKTILFLLFLTGLKNFAQPGQANNIVNSTSITITDNPKKSRLDSIVDKAVAKFIQSPENCGLSIGIIKGDQTWFYNYGTLKKGSAQPTNRQTIYETGALTKTFCGLLLAKAVNEHKIDPEADIRKYLPGRYDNLALGAAFIKVKHLASHSSGLPNLPTDLMQKKGFDSLNPYNHYSKSMLLAYLKTVQPAFEPGKACSYSSMGMAVLGIILEEVYDKSFEQLVKEKICQPLQMSSTGIRLSKAQEEQFAEAYNATGEPTKHWTFGVFGPAGAMRSNTEDLVKYLSYNLAVTDSAVKLSHQLQFSGRENTAMGWYIKKNTGGNLFWHQGATYGFGSFMGFVKEQNCAVVILANTSTSVDFIAIPILRYLQQML